MMVLMGVLFLSGCAENEAETDEDIDAQQIGEEQAEQSNEEEVKVLDGRDINIVYTKDPDAVSPITINGSEQQYEITFPVAMNKLSVENAIKSQLEQRNGNVSFEWNDDQSLLVDVTFDADEIYEKITNAYPFITFVSYTIDLNGSITVNNERFENITPFEISIASAAEEEWVNISLVSNSAVQSPTKLAVHKEHQNFKLEFTEAMNQSTVEEAIMNRLKGNEVVTYEWEDEQTLYINVETDDNILFPMYEINPSGSKTKLGETKQYASMMQVVVEEGLQLWSVALDGSTIEKASNWDDLYTPSYRIDDQNIILTRSLGYCECDASVPQLHYLYDVETEQMAPFTIDENHVLNVVQNYMGVGTFYADKRGFFLNDYDGEMYESLFPQDDMVEIKVDGYVYGAKFNDNKDVVMLLVGEERSYTGEDTEQWFSDMELVLYNLEDGSIEKHELGNTDVTFKVTNNMENRIQIKDDGDIVSIQLRNEESNVIVYEYDWETKEITQHPMEQMQDESMISHSHSDDGVITLTSENNVDWNIFKEDKEVGTWNNDSYVSFQWVPSSHRIVYLSSNEEKGYDLVQYNFDTLTEEVIVEHILQDNEMRWTEGVIGVSDDAVYMIASE